MSLTLWRQREAPPCAQQPQWVLHTSPLSCFLFIGFLDPEKKLFSHRILSRDECIDPFSKTGNLRYVPGTRAARLTVRRPVETALRACSRRVRHCPVAVFSLDPVPSPPSEWTPGLLGLGAGALSRAGGAGDEGAVWAGEPLLPQVQGRLLAGPRV